MFFVFRLLLNALAIFFVAHVIPGVEVRGLGAAIFFSFILGVFNAVLRPLLIILTFPISVITLGVFSLIINAFTFWLASLISLGVYIESASAAFWGGAVVWLLSYLSSLFLVPHHYD